MKKIFVLVLLTAAFVSTSFSQQDKSTQGFGESFNFLLGNWVGEGNGQPGQGNGGFSLVFELDKNILVRKSQTDFPAANGRPAFKHEDLMIIYPSANNSFQAIYFDNEKHIINYSVTTDKDKIVLVSEMSATTPRFRLTYSLISEEKVLITFEIAMPNNPESFSKYLEGTAFKSK